MGEIAPNSPKFMRVIDSSILPTGDARRQRDGFVDKKTVPRRPLNLHTTGQRSSGDRLMPAGNTQGIRVKRNFLELADDDGSPSTSSTPGGRVRGNHLVPTCGSLAGIPPGVRVKRNFLVLADDDGSPSTSSTRVGRVSRNYLDESPTCGGQGSLAGIPPGIRVKRNFLVLADDDGSPSTSSTPVGRVSRNYLVPTCDGHLPRNNPGNKQGLDMGRPTQKRKAELAFGPATTASEAGRGFQALGSDHRRINMAGRNDGVLADCGSDTDDAKASKSRKEDSFAAMSSVGDVEGEQYLSRRHSTLLADILLEAEAEWRAKPFVSPEVRRAEKERTAEILRKADEVVSAPVRAPLPLDCNPVIGFQQNGEINFTRIGSKQVRIVGIVPTRLP